MQPEFTHYTQHDSHSQVGITELGRLRQEDQEFTAGLGYIERPWREAGKSVDLKALSLLYY